MSFEKDNDHNESDDNDGILDLSSASSPTNETEEGGDQVSRKSTSEPLLKKQATTRKKQAEEEYNLIKKLSQSIANKHKRKNLPKLKDTIHEVLSELDGLTSSLAQNKINNIIFQAQGGLSLHRSCRHRRLFNLRETISNQSCNMLCQAPNHRCMKRMVNSIK